MIHLIIIVNILNFVFCLFLIKSPNKGVTMFQYTIVSFIIFIDCIIDSFYNIASLSTSCFKILFGCNLIIWLLVGLIDEQREKNAFYKTDNKFNFISEPYIVLNFPWGKCDFSEVMLNPKFVVKYYQLEKLEEKIKPEFSNFVIRILLQEYFYFKSVYSFCLVKREKHRKDC